MVKCPEFKSCNCWCCFCACCARCLCCRGFDEAETGGRGCCRDKEGDSMCLGCQKVCRKVRKRVRALRPCGCSLKIHYGFIQFECKNRITCKQALVMLSFFKLALVAVGALFYGMYQHRMWLEWQKDIKARRDVRGDEWRTRFYLTTAPPYQEERARRKYCCAALSSCLQLALLIGDMATLFAICCRSMFCCIVFLLIGTLGPVGGLIYQPVEYNLLDRFRGVEVIYTRLNLAFWVPVGLCHVYEMWIMILYMRMIRRSRYGLVDLHSSGDEEDGHAEDNVTRIHRDLAESIVQHGNLTLRDKFYPNPTNNAWILAEEYLVSHPSRVDDRPNQPQLVDLYRDVNRDPTSDDYEDEVFV